MGTTLTGSSAGDFFHRLGELEGAVLDALSYQGGTATTPVTSAAQLPTRLAAWVTDFTAATADLVTLNALQASVVAIQGATPPIVTTIAGLVPPMLQIAANADTPLPTLNVQQAFQLLVAEMIAASATINRGTLPAVGAQTAGIAAVPVGNPTFLWSVVDSAGRGLQYLWPETATITIGPTDAQTGATAGQEPFTFAGQNAQTNFLSWDWLSSKYGSGSSGTGALVDPVVSNTTGANTGNLTVNGGFTTWSNTNYPDNYVYITGVATTNFLNSTATKTYYANGGSLEMLSAGGTKNVVQQRFNTPSSTTAGAGGAPYALVPSAVNNVQYAVFIPIAMKTASPTNGTLTISVVDSGGTTINDDQGNANSVAVDLTAIADTNWHIEKLVFRMPQALPATTPYAIQLAFTGTILDAANAVYVGGVGMQIMTQIYVGGGYLAGFRGSVNPNASGLYPDSWTFAITATIGKLQKAIWRYFNPPQYGGTPGLIVPAVTSGSATIADSLVA